MINCGLTNSCLKEKKMFENTFFFTIGHYELSYFKPTGIFNMCKKVFINSDAPRARELSPIPKKIKKTTDRPTVRPFSPQAYQCKIT